MDKEPEVHEAVGDFAPRVIRKTGKRVLASNGVGNRDALESKN